MLYEVITGKSIFDVVGSILREHSFEGADIEDNAKGTDIYPLMLALLAAHTKGKAIGQFQKPPQRRENYSKEMTERETYWKTLIDYIDKVAGVIHLRRLRWSDKTPMTEGTSADSSIKKDERWLLLSFDDAEKRNNFV